MENYKTTKREIIEEHEVRFHFETFKRESINAELSIGTGQSLIGIDGNVVTFIDLKKTKDIFTDIAISLINDSFDLLKDKKNPKVKIGFLLLSTFKNEKLKNGEVFITRVKDINEANQEVKKTINKLCKYDNPISIKEISMRIIYDS